MEQSRFHNPYKRMVPGLLFEVVVYAALIVLLVLVALAAAALT